MSNHHPYLYCCVCETPTNRDSCKELFWVPKDSGMKEVLENLLIERCPTNEGLKFALKSGNLCVCSVHFLNSETNFTKLMSGNSMLQSLVQGSIPPSFFSTVPPTIPPTNIASSGNMKKQASQTHNNKGFTFIRYDHPESSSFEQPVEQNKSQLLSPDSAIHSFALHSSSSNDENDDIQPPIRFFNDYEVLGERPKQRRASGTRNKKNKKENGDPRTRKKPRYSWSEPCPRVPHYSKLVISQQESTTKMAAGLSGQDEITEDIQSVIVEPSEDIPTCDYSSTDLHSTEDDSNCNVEWNGIQLLFPGLQSPSPRSTGSSGTFQSLSSIDRRCDSSNSDHQLSRAKNPIFTRANKNFNLRRAFSGAPQDIEIITLDDEEKDKLPGSFNQIDIDLSLSPNKSTQTVGWTRFCRAYRDGFLHIRIENSSNNPDILVLRPEDAALHSDTSTDIRELNGKGGLIDAPLVVKQLLLDSSGNEPSSSQGIPDVLLGCNGAYWMIVGRPNPLKQLPSNSTSLYATVQHLEERGKRLEDAVKVFSDLLDSIEPINHANLPKKVDQAVQMDHTDFTDQSTEMDQIHLVDQSSQYEPVEANKVDQSTQVESCASPPPELVNQSTQVGSYAISTLSDSAIRRPPPEHVNQPSSDAEEIVQLKATVALLTLQLKQKKDEELEAVNRRLLQTEQSLRNVEKNCGTIQCQLEKIIPVASTSNAEPPNTLPANIVEVAGPSQISTHNQTPEVPVSDILEIPPDNLNVEKKKIVARKDCPDIDGVYVDSFPLNTEILEMLAKESTASTFVGNLLAYAFTQQYLTEKSLTKMKEDHREAIIHETLKRFHTFRSRDDPMTLQTLNRSVVRSFIMSKFTSCQNRRRSSLVKSEGRTPRKQQPPPPPPPGVS